MPLICPRCERVNSMEASYCWFDGESLAGAAGPVDAGKSAFPSAFVFPSGTKCRDFAEFLSGCDKHWDDAKKLLENDMLRNFFGGIGRMDLAQAAQEAANFPDRDRGLDQFLSRIPVPSATPPKLKVKPKSVQLGKCVPGKDGGFDLLLENAGSRIVFGSVSPDCDWLAATDKGEAKVFQFRESAKIPIRVQGKHLRTSSKPLEAIVHVESNAGTFEVKVVAQVPIVPFESEVLSGASSPREVAEYAKKHPKEAAGLFEEGLVVKWYAANGWTYPVKGPATSGLAAVQQFFEALGLSKPPKVNVDESPIQLRGKPGEMVKHKLQARTEEKRPIYATANSPVSWIVAKPAVSQQNVITLPLEVKIPDRVGETLEAKITVTANGNQQFRVPVVVTVDAEKGESTSASAIASVGTSKGSRKSAPPSSGPLTPAEEFGFAEPAVSSASPRSGRRRSRGSSFKAILHFMPLAMLGMIMCGLVAYDWFFIDTPRPPSPEVKGKSSDQPKDTGNSGSNAVVTDEKDIYPNFVGVPRYTIEDEPEERVGKAKLPPVKVDITHEPPAKNDAGAAKLSLDLKGSYEPGDFFNVTAKVIEPAGKQTLTLDLPAGLRLAEGAPTRNLPLPPASAKETSLEWKVRVIAAGSYAVRVTSSAGGTRTTNLTIKQGRTAGEFEIGLAGDFQPGKAFDISTKLVKAVPGEKLTLILPAGLTLTEGMETQAATPKAAPTWKVGIGQIGKYTIGVKSSVGLTLRKTLIVEPPGNPAGHLAFELIGDIKSGKEFSIKAQVTKSVPGQTLKLDLPEGLKLVEGDAKEFVPRNADPASVTWRVRVTGSGRLPVRIESSTGQICAKTITLN